ncbi:MAG: hypothetical protein M3Q97_11420 [Bacteroidota bacterium]|nr:hypothetical protein [Bacteroidota bacterium]
MQEGPNLYFMGNMQEYLTLVPLLSDLSTKENIDTGMGLMVWREMMR